MDLVQEVFHLQHKQQIVQELVEVQENHQQILVVQYRVDQELLRHIHHQDHRVVVPEEVDHQLMGTVKAEDNNTIHRKVCSTSLCEHENDFFFLFLVSIMFCSVFLK